MNGSPSSLVARHIYHRYRTAGGDLLALENISLELRPETFTCLIGPSGCGKSTFLRILSGLIKPSEGSIQLDGKPLVQPQRQIGLVFQDPNLMPWRTVEQNICLPLEVMGVPRHERKARAAKMLALLGLSEFAHAYPSALSGGMAQRLAVGRALIHQPSVLLLDEPFGALDALTREQVSEELLRIWAQDRKTVLMVTHSIREAILLADRVFVMSPRPGRIIKEIPLPLPRPRTFSMIAQPQFTELEVEIRSALRLT